MNNDFITIAEFEGMHDANLSYICTRLDEVGIQYYLMDSLSSTVLNHLVPTITAVKLRIAAYDAEEAAMILEEIDNTHDHEVPMNTEDVAWMAEREAEVQRSNTIVNQGLKLGLIMVVVIVLMYLLTYY